LKHHFRQEIISGFYWLELTKDCVSLLQTHDFMRAVRTPLEMPLDELYFPQGHLAI
jgi:hypothetical protein